MENAKPTNASPRGTSALTSLVSAVLDMYALPGAMVLGNVPSLQNLNDSKCVLWEQSVCQGKDLRSTSAEVVQLDLHAGPGLSLLVSTAMATASRMIALLRTGTAQAAEDTAVLLPPARHPGEPQPV